MLKAVGGFLVEFISVWRHPTGLMVLGNGIKGLMHLQQGMGDIRMELFLCCFR